MIDTIKELKPYHKVIEVLEQTLNTKNFIIDDLPVYYVLTDHESKILYYNHLALNRLKKSESDILYGQKFVNKIPRSIQSDFSNYYQNNINYISKSLYTVIDNSQADHEILWQISKVNTGPTNENQFIAIIGINANEIKNQYKGEVLRMAKMSSICTLSNGIAHEFNNPLAIIRMSVDSMARSGAANLGIQKNINLISKSIDRMSKIINDLKKLANGESEDHINTYSINSIVEDFFEYKIGYIQSKNIKIMLKLAQNLPKITCSKKDLDMVLHILLCNAIDAITQSKNEKNQIDIKTYFNPNSSSLQLEVKDSGIGMSSKEIEKIYDPFFTTKSVGKGMGLSLSILYSILDRHGCSIKIDSEPNQGTKFIIFFTELKDAIGT